MKDFFAPDIDSMIESLGHQSRLGEPSNIDAETHEAIDRLYAAVEGIAVNGDDNLRKCWITIPRGPEEAYLSHWYDEDEEEYCGTKEEVLKDWLQKYPDDECWFFFSCRDYNGHRTICLSHTTVFYQAPEREAPYYGMNYADEVDFITERVKASMELMARNEYNAYVSDHLPLKHRFGTIDSHKLWKLLPDEQWFHMTDDELAECERNLSKLDERGYPRSYKDTFSVNDYLTACEAGYRDAYPDKIQGMTKEEMYKRFADDRDGGLLKIDRSSPEAFAEWYAIDDKWEIENPSHLWETISGSSRTRMHMYVSRNDHGWYMMINGSHYTCIDDTLRFLNGVSRTGMPVGIYQGETLLDIIKGNKRTGIIPCEYDASGFMYGGFPVTDVYHFMELPCEPVEGLLEEIEWLPIEPEYLEGQEDA